MNISQEDISDDIESFKFLGSNMTQKKNCKYLNNPYVVVGLFLIAVIFLIVKAHFILSPKDEWFYLATPYRMIKGDIMFWDESILIILSAPLMVPFQKLFLLFNGNNDGILLAFHYFYIFVTLLISVFIYKRLKRISEYSLIVALIFFLYNPSNHLLFSYVSLGYIAGFIMIVLLVTYENKRAYYFSGICYAIAAVCQPILVPLFLVVTLGIVIIKREIIKKYCYFLLGTITLAIPYIVYILFVSKINRVIRMLPICSGTYSWGHALPKNIVGIFKYYCWALFPERSISIGSFNIHSGVIAGTIWLAIIVSFVLFLASSIRHKAISKKVILFTALCATMFDIVCMIAIMRNTINVCLLPWIFVGIMLYKTSSENIKKLFKVAAIWSSLHTVSFLTSNLGFHMFALGCSSVCMVSILMLVEHLKTKCNKGERYAFGTMVTIIVITLLVTGSMYTVFTISHNPKKMNVGPAKDIYVDSNTYNTYKTTYEDMQEVNKLNGKVLLFTENPYISLISKNKIGQFSTIFEDTDKYSVQLLKDFYRVNTKANPKYAYIPEQSLKSITLNYIIRELNFNKDKTIRIKNGYILKK